jgi:hypothetical protein
MTGPTETTQSRSAGTQDQTHPVYVYGVIPAADADQWPETPGLGGSSTVRTVTEGGMAALISDLPPDHTPGRLEDLEAHRQVLSQAIERGTAIPMRFGVVMDGDDVVRQRLLARHAAELSDVLRTLDGHVQMNVKAFYAEDALLEDVLSSQPDLARQSAALAQLPESEMSAARVQFGEMVAKAVEARRAEVESALMDRLSPLAFNAQLLVHRDRRAALDDQVRELSETLSGILAFRYIGPLAPFSFADLALDEDEEPWG